MDAHGPRANRTLRVASGTLTILMLGAGFYLALAPYLVFHTMNRYGYEWYHSTGPILAELALIPGNVWFGATVAPRMFRTLWGHKPTYRLTAVIITMAVITLVAAGALYLAFAVIYLSTVNWFVF